MNKQCEFIHYLFLNPRVTGSLLVAMLVSWIRKIFLDANLT